MGFDKSSRLSRVLQPIGRVAQLEITAKFMAKAAAFVSVVGFIELLKIWIWPFQSKCFLIILGKISANNEYKARTHFTGPLNEQSEKIRQKGFGQVFQQLMVLNLPVTASKIR